MENLFIPTHNDLQRPSTYDSPQWPRTTYDDPQWPRTTYDDPQPFISDHINAEKASGIQRKYKIIFVPKKVLFK